MQAVPVIGIKTTGVVQSVCVMQSALGRTSAILSLQGPSRLLQLPNALLWPILCGEAFQLPPITNMRFTTCRLGIVQETVDGRPSIEETFSSYQALLASLTRNNKEAAAAAAGASHNIDTLSIAEAVSGGCLVRHLMGHEPDRWLFRMTVADSQGCIHLA